MDAASPAPALLELSGLEVSYRIPAGEVCALRGISLRLGEHTRLGLLGESGSGKTTLARTVGGMLPASARTRGVHRFRGRLVPPPQGPVWQRPANRAVSLIGQEPRAFLNPVMPAGSQVAEVCRARGVRGAALQVRLRSALDRAGVDARIAGAYPHQLSGGDCQRVAVAQALAAQPELLVADEPTSSLDACAQAELLSLLGGLLEAEPFALILISHSPAVLAQLAAQVAVLYDGQVIETGPAPEIFRRPLHPYTRLLLECYPHRTDARARLPVIDNPAAGGDPAACGCRFQARCPDRIAACLEADPPLRPAGPEREVRCVRYAG